MIKSKSGQVWIETVLYTLIGLALISAVLLFVTPKISETKDKALVDQSIEAMKVLDSKIQNIILRGSGNIGKIQDFSLKRGTLLINTTNDTISLNIDGLSGLYSEPNVPIYNGRVKIISTESQKSNSVSLTLAFNTNITYNDKDQIQIKQFTAASTPYAFSIQNVIYQDQGVIKQYLNITETSGR